MPATKKYPVLQDRTFVEPWESVPTPTGELEAGLYEHRDGRRHLYLWSDGEDIQGREGSRNVTRIGYRTWSDEGVQFLGMSVSNRSRGARVGQALVEHFMNTVTGHEGMPVVGTGLIHKPLVALTLSRVGLEPDSTDCVAEILPRSSRDTSSVPKISIIRAPEHDPELVDRSLSGKFYEIIDPAEVLRTYPLNNPGMTVALNTRYSVV